MAALIRPGDEVLFELPATNPCSQQFVILARTSGASGDVLKCLRYRLDELSSLVTDQTRLIVLTNLHNPSAVLIDDDVLRECR
jgi:aspartate/methionine/tyrosine aminotransferase